jgi:formyltetrahydrofolate hydrolase
MTASTIPHLVDHASIIVHGPDQPGIVGEVAALVARNGGNIISLDQYSSNESGGDFFQRIVMHRDGLSAWPFSHRRATTACSTFCGVTAAASCPSRSR